MNKRFYVKNIGEVEYIATLFSADYPVTFVTRKVDSSCELYIFDEIKTDDVSITWICSRISVDEFDGLNKGTKSLNSCFCGPRHSKKQGYLVISKSGNEIADSVLIEDTSIYVGNEEVFVPQFVDDNHGSNILSMATGKLLFSLVLNDERYADPFFDIKNMSDSATDGKLFIASLPYGISIRNNRACVQSNQSIVINFEISDKPIKESNDRQLKIEQVDNETKNIESREALKSIQLAFESGNDSEKLLTALNNDKKAIKKFNKFLNTIKKNKCGGRCIQFVDSNNEKPLKNILLTDEVVEIAYKNSNESLSIIDNQEKKRSHIIRTGYFEMFDNKERRRFRFIGDDKNIYRGIASNDFDITKCPIIMQDSKTRYIIKMEESYYIVNNRNTKPSYSLLSVEKEIIPIQETFKYN